MRSYITYAEDGSTGNLLLSTEIPFLHGLGLRIRDDTKGLKSAARGRNSRTARRRSRYARWNRNERKKLGSGRVKRNSAIKWWDLIERKSNCVQKPIMR